MNVFLIIIAIHAALVGFGLLFAGFASLAEPDEAEVEATRERFRAERAKGKWRYAMFCIGQIHSDRYRGFDMAISHWPKRPKCRRLIYAGLACLAIAAAIGYRLGAFDS